MDDNGTNMREIELEEQPSSSIRSDAKSASGNVAQAGESIASKSESEKGASIDSAGAPRAQGSGVYDEEGRELIVEESSSPDDLEQEDLPETLRGEPECACGVKYATKGYHLMFYPFVHYVNDYPQLIKECLAGLSVAFAQLSDSIAFSFIAGVPPEQGLHAAWIIGLTMGLLGSRPGMINGATGVRAAVIAPYVEQYGVSFLFYIVVAISIFQFLASFLSLARLVRMVPRTVMVGFVCGLAIILALGQQLAFKYPGEDRWRDTTTSLWMLFVATCTVLAAVFVPMIPYAGKVFPPSMWGIIAAVVVEFGIVRTSGYSTPAIGDVADAGGSLPTLFFLDDRYDIPPLNWEAVQQAIVPAFLAAAAGMVEAVMTMEVVNDLTETDNPYPDQQLLSLGIGNFLAGMLGTMGGGATIGPSIINCTNGANGQYRLSAIVAAVFMLVIILAASPLISVIPTASLVGIMAVVCFHTFEWSAIPVVFFSLLPQSWREHEWLGGHGVRKINRMEAVVIIVVTAVTVIADLFTAVAVGVALTACEYAWREGASLAVTSRKVRDADGKVVRVYRLNGPLFFASAMGFIKKFDPKRDPDEVEVHFQESQLHDYSGMHALNVIGEKYRKEKKHVRVRHLCIQSERRLRKADALAEFFSYKPEGVAEELQDPDHLNRESTSVLVQGWQDCQE